MIAYISDAKSGNITWMIMNLLKKLCNSIFNKFKKKTETQVNLPLIQHVSAPELPNPCPGFAVHGWNGFGAPYGTIEWQASKVYTNIATGLRLTNHLLDRPLHNFFGTHNLIVLPRAEHKPYHKPVYDRLSLKFFYDRSSMIYPCETTDVVNHALWHAILDALRPDLWHLQSLEICAFHEAFADIGAILTALSHDAIIDYVIRETGGDLKHPKVIARLSEEMGGTLYNAINTFHYAPPESLPLETPPSGDSLTGCPSSFSRVFTSAFYDILCLMHRKLCQTTDPMEALRQSRDIVGRIILNAVRDAATSSKFFNSVARAMLLHGATNADCATLISEAFSTRGISCELPLTNRPQNLRMIYYKDCKIHRYGNHSSVRLGGTKQLKLNGIAVDIPNDHYLEYMDDRLIVDIQSNEKEAIASAQKCIELSHMYNDWKIGDDKEFSIVENKLIRNYI